MQKNNIKKITMLSLLLLMGINSQTNAYEGKTVDTKNIKTWNQNAYPQAYNIRLRNGGETIAEAGCGYFSLTTLARKNGFKDLMPEKVVYRVRENGATNSWWGHTDWTKIKKLGYNFKLPDANNLYGLVKNNGHYYPTNYSYKSNLDTIRKLSKNGYYIIICMQNGQGGGHYVAVDYIDKNGNIRITDSAYKGTWLSDYYGRNNLSIQYYVILESTKTPSYNTYSVYDDDNAKEYNNSIDKRIEEEKRIEKQKQEEEKRKHEKQTKEQIDKLFSIKNDNVYDSFINQFK